jgi:hypothetical protein
MTVNWTKAQRKAAHTARWAVTMTKVRIRQTLARTRWQLVTFCGVSGAESVGVVDLMAIRKDHRKPLPGTKPLGGKTFRTTQIEGSVFEIALRTNLLDPQRNAYWLAGGTCVD